MFKNIDKKFEEIGFTKVSENDSGVIYEREVKRFNYTQVIDIIFKEAGRHIVHSYDKDLGDDEGIGNTSVGLTYYEMKLILKKMKQLGYHKHSK